MTFFRYYKLIGKRYIYISYLYDGEKPTLYLPRKLKDWYHEEAKKMMLEDGEHLFFTIRQYAEERGFTCTHPGMSQVLYQKARPSVQVAALWRCRDCGYLYFKSKDGTNKAKIEAVE